MKFGWIVICLFALVCSCQTELLKSKKKAKMSEGQNLLFQTINDSTFRYELVHEKGINVAIINSAQHLSMLVNRFGMKDSIDFEKENIQAKTPELKWMNDEFICVDTWWSADFFSSLIIPFRKKYKSFMYFEHGIQACDLKNNRIVYADQFMDKKVCFAIENLASGKKQRIYWKIPSNRLFHPYCDSLTFENDCLLIWNKAKETRYPINL